MSFFQVFCEGKVVGTFQKHSSGPDGADWLRISFQGYSDDPDEMNIRELFLANKVYHRAIDHSLQWELQQQKITLQEIKRILRIPSYAWSFQKSSDYEMVFAWNCVDVTPEVLDQIFDLPEFEPSD